MRLSMQFARLRLVSEGIADSGAMSETSLRGFADLVHLLATRSLNFYLVAEHLPKDC